MDENIFTLDASDSTTLNNGGRPEADPSKNYLEELVGEGKKFKSAEELARGKYEADMFIKSLLREKDELREELLKSKTVEDLLGKLEAKGDSVNRMTTENNQTQENRVNENQSIDLASIKSEIKRELEAEAEAARQDARLKEIQDKLVEAHGSVDAARAFINSKAKELNVSIDQLLGIAKTSPKAFYAAVGAVEGPAQKRQNTNDFFSTPNAVNTSGLKTPVGWSGDHKPMSFYQDMKQRDFKKYVSRQTQLQMHKDAMAMGEIFFTT